MKALLFFLLVIVVFSACQSDDKDSEIFSGSYLPLQIGNYWNFKPMNESSAQIHREVAAKVIINEYEYFMLVNSATTNNQLYKDSSYYRVTSDGNVYIYRKGQREENRFRLDGNDGDNWTYPKENNASAKITLSVLSVTLNAKQINTCKSYYFDVEAWADEENTVVLAPGIGFVREYSDAWGVGYTLESARIGEKDYNF